MPTPMLATAKKNDVNNVLAEFLPKLTAKQKDALQKIALLDTLPNNITKWCEILNITRHTYYNWITNRDWRSAFIEINRAVESTNLPTIMAHVRKRAGKSDVASRTHLEYIGALPTAQSMPSVNNNTVNIAFISANKDKIKAIADQLADSLSTPEEVNPDVIEGQIDGE